MSKRKRPTPKDATPATPPEGGEGDPTVHISSDMLAGSPDIFAPAKARPGETPAASESGEPEAMSSDVPPEEPPAPIEEAPAPAATQAAVVPPPAPPTTYPLHARRMATSA